MPDGLTYRNAGPWGAGKGAPLTSLEGDNNFYDVMQRILNVENNPIEPTSIERFVITGSQFQVLLTNGDLVGPYSLPVAQLKFRGDWMNNMVYSQLDVVAVPGVGLFLVRVNHTSPVAPAPFDQYAQAGGVDLYLKVFGELDYIYDLGFFFPGRPGQGIAAGDDMMGFAVIRPFYMPVDVPGSQALLRVACADQLILSIFKNGVECGAVTFEAGTTTGAISVPNATQFIAGDYIGFPKPDTLDASARILAISIAAVRGMIPA